MSKSLESKLVLKLLKSRKQKVRESLEEIEKDIIEIEFTKNTLVNSIKSILQNNNSLEMIDYNKSMNEIGDIQKSIFCVENEIIEYNREVKAVYSMEIELNISYNNYEKLPLLNDDSFKDVSAITDLLFKALSGDEVIKDDKKYQDSNEVSELLLKGLTEIMERPVDEDPEIEEPEIKAPVFLTVSEAIELTKEQSSTLNLTSQGYKLINDLKSQNSVSSIVNVMLELIYLSNGSKVIYSSIESLLKNHPQSFKMTKANLGRLINILEKMKWIFIGKDESNLTKTIHLDKAFLDSDKLVNLLYLMQEQKVNANTLKLFTGLYNDALETGITMVTQDFKNANYLNLNKLKESKLIKMVKNDVYINKEIFIDK